MEVFLTPHFKRTAKRLPRAVRSVVERKVALFIRDAFDPALKTHKLSGRLRAFWSFSVDHRIRIIFELEGKMRAVFHVIGDHSVYDDFDA